MVTQEWLNGVIKIADKLIEQRFPILGSNYFKSGDVRIILEAHELLLKEWDNAENTKT
jgi:hypothetical protein